MQYQSEYLHIHKLKLILMFLHNIQEYHYLFQHINKIDTWGIIILCLFIDFLVPLGMFLMLKNGKGDITKPVKTKAEDFNSKK